MSPFSIRYTVQRFPASHVNLSEIHDVSTMLHGTSVLERLIVTGWCTDVSCTSSCCIFCIDVPAIEFMPIVLLEVYSSWQSASSLFATFRVSLTPKSLFPEISGPSVWEFRYHLYTRQHGGSLTVFSTLQGGPRIQL